jgi:photosystem II stability/assembly factor-like uncharacterized protein
MKDFRILAFVAAVIVTEDIVFAQIWTQTSAPITNWTAVASSADGSRLAAAANGDVVLIGGMYSTLPGPVYISTNSGVTWFESTNAPNAVWSSVVFCADGSKLTAAVAGGWIYQSPDAGLTWTPTGAPSNYWVSVTSSADGNRLAALARAFPPPDFYISSDAGNTWNTNASPYDRWTALASSADGNILVASGAIGTLLSSTNRGSSWTTNIINTTSFSSVASSADGGRLLAAGNKPYLSTNHGLAWLQISAPDVYRIASSADGRTVVAAAYAGPIYVSTDFGASWTTNVPPGSNYWTATACSADGSKRVAVAKANGGGGGIWISQTTPTPQINLAPTNGHLAFSWIIPSTNFVLQESEDLTYWMEVTNEPVLNLTNLLEEVTLPVTSGNAFYRLATP